MALLAGCTGRAALPLSPLSRARRIDGQDFRPVPASGTTLAGQTCGPREVLATVTWMARVSFEGLPQLVGLRP
eukprot:scaffold4768_cov412-Prasinococcus_capsulatus_cf.AAC.7